MKTSLLRTFKIMSFLLTAAPAFFFTTYQLFLVGKGISIFEMSLINAAFMFSVFILEVPTGAFADSFGRRRSIIFGCIAWGLSFYVYFFSDNLLAFIGAEIIGAFGYTLISGALEAWIVDSLRWQESQVSLEKIFRQEEHYKQAGIIIGSFTGALLGGHNLALPWLFSGTGMLLAALAAFIFMREPYFQRHRLRFSLKSLRQTAQLSWQQGKGNPAFLRLAAISAVLAMSVQALNMQWTLLFREGFRMPMWSLGLIFSGVALAITLGARLAPLVAKKQGHEGQGLALAFTLTGLMMIFSGQAAIFLPALIFFLVHELGRGLFVPLKKAAMNRRLQQENRATMLSLESMGVHAGAFLGLLGSGWLGSHYSISLAWTSSGLLLILLAPFIWKKGL